MQRVPAGLLWWSLGEEVWSKSEQAAVHMLCLSQTLESGSVDEGGTEGTQTDRSLQLRAPESGRETPAKNNHTRQTLVILRSEPKCHGSKRTFLPKPGLRDSFWRR